MTKQQGTSKTVSFTLKRETKNTYRFQEEGDEPQHAIGTLYIKKSVFSGAQPQRITVNIVAE